MIPKVSALPAFAREKGGHFHCSTQLAGGLSHPLEPLCVHRSAAGSRSLTQGSDVQAEVAGALSLWATLQTHLNSLLPLKPQLTSARQTHGLLQEQDSRRWSRGQRVRTGVEAPKPWVPCQRPTPEAPALSNCPALNSPLLVST